MKINRPGPPRFLRDGLFTVIQDNLSYQNGGAEILSCDYCQGYSDLKRVFRYNPDDFLAGKGTATAAMTLPASEARSSVRTRDTQQKLLRRLQGESTPEEPEASRPFARERQRIQHALSTNEFAFRIEQVISLDVASLYPERRNIWTVLRPIFQLMRFYLQEAERYTPFLRRFQPTVFPQILGSFARVFDAAMVEMLRRYRAQGSKGLGFALAEGVAALDRLGHYCFTGMPKVLVRSVLGPLHTLESLRKGAWPYLDPALLDLRSGEGHLDVVRWPRAADGRPIFMHVAALHFHYGAEVAASQHSLLWFRDLGGRSITGPLSAARFLADVFRDLWIPQMVAYINRQVLPRLSTEAGLDDELAADVLAQEQQRRAQLEAWAKEPRPFSWVQYEGIWRMATAAAGPAGSIPSQSQQDFAARVYRGCLANDAAARLTLAAPHSTWFAVLHAVFAFTPAERVSEEQWLSGLAAALRSNDIECMPGQYRARITSRRVVRLVGAMPPPRVMAARPGSTKREAMEVELRAMQPLKRRVIDIGEIPFTRLPTLVKEGFAKLAKTFATGDQKVAEHYHVARTCLEELLGKEPLCDLLLMLVVTFASSSVTPAVSAQGKGFEEGKQKDAEQFAANMATRMVWYLRPKAFPWEKDAGMVLRISEMTKKMEHKGVNNRFLCELGWVRTLSKRANPRNTELTLRPALELLQLRKELLSLRKRPERFIARVFQSSESVWVERCSAVVQEQE